MSMINHYDAFAYSEDGDEDAGYDGDLYDDKEDLADEGATDDDTLDKNDDEAEEEGL